MREVLLPEELVEEKGLETIDVLEKKRGLAWGDTLL